MVETAVQWLVLNGGPGAIIGAIVGYLSFEDQAVCGGDFLNPSCDVPFVGVMNGTKTEVEVMFIGMVAVVGFAINAIIGWLIRMQRKSQEPTA